MLGSPTETRCEIVFSIDGPGLTYTRVMPGDCFVLKEKLPLLVYATPALWMDGNYYPGKTPIDGVVRNLAFRNLDTHTTIQSACSV